MGRLVPGQEFETFIEPDSVADAVLFCLTQRQDAVSDEILINRMVYR